MTSRITHSCLLVLFAITTFGQNAESYLRAGNAAYDELDFDLAKSEYNSARDADIQNASAAFNLGLSLFQVKDFGGALAQFDAVVSLSKDAQLQSRAFYNKGNCLLELKNYEQSVEAFKEALRRNPADDNARYNLVYATKFSNLPVAVCKDTVLYLNTRGVASIKGFQLDAGSHDNGKIVSYKAEPNNLYCENLGENLVKMIVTDDEGNSTFCHARITVKDTLIPNAVCRVDTIRLDSIGIARVQAKRLDGGSTDNCSIAKHMARPSQFTKLGTHWVTLAVADSSGNIDSCRTKIIVEEFDPEKDEQEQQEQEQQEQEQQEQEQQEQEQQDEQKEDQNGDDQQDDKGKDGEGQDEKKDASNGEEGGPKDGSDKQASPVGLTKEQAEQLLEAIEQDEKGTQKKVQKAIFGKKGKNQDNAKSGKDW